jgi:hypothetical protein
MLPGVGRAMGNERFWVGTVARVGTWGRSLLCFLLDLSLIWIAFALVDS